MNTIDRDSHSLWSAEREGQCLRTATRRQVSVLPKLTRNMFTQWSASVLLVCLQLWVDPIDGHAAGTAVYWDLSGQTTIANGLSNVVAIAVGGHYLALNADGWVRRWGGPVYSEAAVPSTLSNVVAIAAGGYHSLALTAKGEVVGWGTPYPSTYEPDVIPTGLSNVVAIAAGHDHSMALTAGGQVVGWGSDQYDQIPVPDGLSNIVAIAGGTDHSMALTAGGQVVGWGYNRYSPTPTNIPTGLSNMVAIAAGSFHRLALTSDGRVVCWGRNDAGQTNVPIGLSNVVAIAGGYNQSMALTTDGRVVCWGGDCGQATIPSGLSNLVAISSGNLAIQTDGTPAIVGQPLARSATVGDTVALQVRAAGAPRLRYQWRKDGVSVVKATNSTIVLSGVSTNDAGDYDVVVWNEFGSATSSRAILQVVPYAAPSIRINGRLAVGTVSAVSPVTVSLTGGFTNGLIFYTLDGSMPNVGSSLYTAPFSITNNATLLAMGLSEDFAESAVAPAVTVVVVPTYALTTSTEGSGSVGVNPAHATYPSNSVVTLTAYASVHYAFSHWTGDLMGNVNPANLTMNRPRSVQAVFVPTAFPLTISTLGGGTLTADSQNIGPNTYYPTGAVVSLAANSDSGWRFLRWEGTVTGAENPIPVLMNQSNNLRAVFGTDVHSVVTGSGTILVSPTNPVPYGATVMASAIPSPGSSFVVWSGAASGTANPTTIRVTNATPRIGAAFTGPPVPVVLSHPTNLTVLVGQRASFAVTVGGATPLCYQWRKATNVIVDATNATYIIGTTVLADAGDYYVVITNTYGGATSLVAMLTVASPPTITVPPQSQIAAAGATLTLRVDATGDEPLRYQWLDRTGIVPDATNAIYILESALTNHTGHYAVTVSNAYGMATSSVATVTVYVPVEITAQPAMQVVAAGGTATFQVSATGYPAPTFQWWFKGAAIPGATGSSLVITNVGTNALGTYVAEARNAYSSATSAPAQLLMSPSLRSPFAGATGTWGKPASLSVVALGSEPLSYQWFKDGAPVAGGTNDTLVFATVQMTDGGLYSVAVSNPWGSVTNVPAQFVVNAANVGLGLYAGVLIEGVPGYTYGIQFTTDMTDTNSWATATNLTLTQPVELWVDTATNVHSATNPKRFYRVVAR